MSSGSSKKDGEAPFNNPFAALKDQLHDLPDAKPEPPPKGPARAVIQYERKGHGGKEVTRVEGLELSLVQRETWLREAKRALGCGGKLEGDALLLQGDQRERLVPWLLERGVKKVVGG